MRIRKTKPRTEKTNSFGIEFVNQRQAKDQANKLGLIAGPLSFTQISTFMLCPTDYYYKYVKRLPREGWNENLILGHGIHAGFEHLNSDMMHISDRNKIGQSHINKAKEHCLRDVEQNIAQYDDITITRRVKLVLQAEKCGEIIAAWYEKYGINTNPTGVEKKMYVLINGVPVVLIIDLIDGTIVKDYKLTRRAKSAKTALNSLQLSLYAAVEDTDKAGFISCPFPDLGKRKPKIEPVEVIVTKPRGELEWALEIIQSVYDNIVSNVKSGTFAHCDPDSWKCSENYCDWWNNCRGKYSTSVAKATPEWLKTK